jgi:hypothetical protein
MNVNELFPSRFVKGDDLGDKRPVVTIRSCSIEEMGKDKERHPVLWFKGTEKGLVLNKTNAMTIAALYGPEMNEWLGKRITLYTERVRIGGENKIAIRVVKQVPAPVEQKVLIPEPVSQGGAESGGQAPLMSTSFREMRGKIDESRREYLMKVVALSNQHDSLFNEPSDVGDLMDAMRIIDANESAPMPTVPTPGKAHSMYSYLLELIEELVGSEGCGEPILSYLLGRVITGETPPLTDHRFLLDDLKPDGPGEYAEAVVSIWGVICDNVK